MVHKTNFKLVPTLLFLAWEITEKPYWESILVAWGGKGMLLPLSQPQRNTIYGENLLWIFGELSAIDNVDEWKSIQMKDKNILYWIND